MSSSVWDLGSASCHGGGESDSRNETCIQSAENRIHPGRGSLASGRTQVRVGFFKEQNAMTRSFRLLLGKVALLFAVLFSVVAGGQYWFVSHQLHQTTQNQLLRAAEGIRADIGFQSAWDLLRYRRVSSEAGADIYAVVSATGTVIDVIGYAPSLLPKVSFPFVFKDDEPFRAKSDVGENWVFYVHKLKDGMAILGTRTDGLLEDVEQRIRINAKRLGNTVAQAVQVQERSIDGLFDFAVVDEGGMLRQSLTGIPLRTLSLQIPAKPTFIPLRAINGGLYAMLEDPIDDKNGLAVGVIRVFRDVTNTTRASRSRNFQHRHSGCYLACDDIDSGGLFEPSPRGRCNRATETSPHGTAHSNLRPKWLHSTDVAIYG